MFHSLWCLGAQRKGMVIYMIRGVHFKIPQKMDNIIFNILCCLNVESYYWFKISSQTEVWGEQIEEDFFEKEFYKGDGQAVRVSERVGLDLRLLRVRRGSGAVSGRGVRRGVPRRGGAAAEGVDRRDQRLRARDERISEADVLHAEPRRAEPRVF